MQIGLSGKISCFLANDTGSTNRCHLYLFSERMSGGRVNDNVILWFLNGLDIRIKMAVLSKKLLFCHIPKTSGASFSILLSNQVDLTEYCTQWKTSLLAELTEKQRSQYTIFAGHFDGNTLSLIPDNINIQHLTFLRDPISTIVSLYRHARRDKNSEFYEIANRGDIFDFIGAHPNHVNFQLNWLMYYLEPFHGLKNSRLTDEEKYQIVSPLMGEVFQFIGISELMQESVDLACWKYRLFQFQEMITYNVAGDAYSLELTGYQSARLRTMFKYDYYLYLKGLEIFMDRYREMLNLLGVSERHVDGTTIRESIRNATLDTFYSAKPNIPAAAYRITGRSAINGYGWWYRTTEPVSNEWIIWSGPEQYSELFFRQLQPGEYRIEMHLSKITPESIIRNLKLCFNGITLTYNIEDGGTDYHLGAKLASSSILTRNFLGITSPDVGQFLIENILDHSSNTFHPDDRMVGIGLKYLAIEKSRS